MEFEKTERAYYENLEIVETTYSESVEDRQTRIDASEGDWLLLAVDFFEAARADLVDESGEIVEPEAIVQVSNDSGGFFCKAYKIFRSGVYHTRITANRATATVIRFVKESALALIGKGEPNQTTCFGCSKIVSVVAKMILAAYGIHIPSLDIGIPWDEVEHLTRLLPIDINDLFVRVANMIPDQVKERLEQPLQYLFDLLKGRIDDFVSGPIPSILKNPIGWASKKACRAINLCPA